MAKATAHYTSRDGVDWLNGLDLFATHHDKKRWFVPLWHAIRDCHVGYAKMTLSHGDWCVRILLLQLLVQRCAERCAICYF